MQTNGLGCETFVRSHLVDPDFINKEFEDAGVPFEKDIIVPSYSRKCALTPPESGYNNIDFNQVAQQRATEILFPC
jgi:hypothetical protein